MNIIKLMRPHQWVKNGFIFLPMFFGGKLADAWCWHQCLVMFFAFSLVASSVYCINDIRDADADRRHPVKCRRPVASGAVAKSVAAATAVILAVVGASLCLAAGSEVFPSLVFIVALYLALNLAYCFRLKQFPIIDVMIVAFGFVLRLVSGGVACDIWLSPWIVSLTFLLALFLAFAKRRDDVVLTDKGEPQIRRSVRGYTPEFLNQTLGILAAVTIVCYIMYSVSPDVTARIGSDYVYATSIFVLGGILRYLQLTIVSEKSGSPTKVLLTDRFIQLMILLWIVMFIFLLYT